MLLAYVTAAAQVGPPLVDHHQHLFSPAAAILVTPNPLPPGATAPQPIDADKLIAVLDSAGIRRALVLSIGYTWGNPSRTVENEYEKVKAENDYTAQQVSKYPDRLRAFCSFNPLRDYALEELNRCAANPLLKNGLKLHIGNSAVDYHDAQHVAQLRRVFRAANERRMPIVIHMRSSISRRMPYGRAEARIFYDSILSSAPDIPVQIAHLAGAGGYDPTTDSALAVFVEAIERREPRARQLWFDVTTVARGASAENGKLLATRIRQLGVGRILYGSDAAGGSNLAPREAWAEFLRLPLTEAEFRTIANNVAPYMAEHTPATADSVWGAALSRLNPGTRVRIHAGGQSIEGDFVDGSGPTLTLAVQSGSRDYTTGVMDSLWVRRSSAKTGAIIGAIPGAVLGTTLGIIANGAGCQDDGGDPCPEAVVVLGLAGAAAGAVLGAVIGSFIHRWERRIP